MKGVYLVAHSGKVNFHNIDYNDIEPGLGCNIIKDALQVDLRPYDFILASPPCNYWSKANIRRNTSIYAQRTKHLLPSAISKLAQSKKPFIIENVRNKPLFIKHKIFYLVNKFGLFVYEVNRHTYITNVAFNPYLPKITDFKENGIRLRSKHEMQGGGQVRAIFEQWLAMLL